MTSRKAADSISPMPTHCVAHCIWPLDLLSQRAVLRLPVTHISRSNGYFSVFPHVTNPVFYSGSHCFPLEKPPDPGVPVSPEHVHLHRCCKPTSFSFLPNLILPGIQWKPEDPSRHAHFPLHSSCHLLGSGPVSDVRTATKPPNLSPCLLSLPLFHPSQHCPELFYIM